LNANLKETAGRSGTGLRHNKLRATLVVSEVALALILLVGSALLIFTQVAMTSVNPGFDATNVLTMRMSLTGQRFEKSAGVAQLVRDATERLRALPGVVNASATCCVPLEGGYGLPFRISGRPLPPTGGPFHGGGCWNTISPGYFDVFKMKIKRGRDFTEQDNGGSPAVVIINEAMARQYWVKRDDPLDSRLVIGRGIMREFADEPERQIIGIVSDVRDAGLNVDPQPRMYIPQAQTPDLANALNVRISPMAWVVRTQVKPQTMTARVQEELRQVTGLPVADIRPMDEVISRSTSRGRFNMLLMTIFAGSALLLAAIGIYGLMAYVVEQRTQEMGIRLALGAEPARLKNSVFIQGLKLSLAGVALGVSFAFALTRFVASYLYEVKPWDPTVFAGVPLLLSAVALLAIWIPARRASHINPMDALRYE
jgi:predicted permease